MSKTSIIDTAVLKGEGTGVCNEGGTHLRQPRSVALLHHGQQGHSEKSDELMILVTIYRKR